MFTQEDMNRFATSERKASEKFQAQQAAKARAENYLQSLLAAASENKFSAAQDYTGGASEAIDRTSFSPSGRKDSDRGQEKSYRVNL